jgi:hypothetical protein
MEKISYGGWKNCIRLENCRIELIATTLLPLVRETDSLVNF